MGKKRDLIFIHQLAKHDSEESLPRNNKRLHFNKQKRYLDFPLLPHPPSQELQTTVADENESSVQRKMKEWLMALGGEDSDSDGIVGGMMKSGASMVGHDVKVETRW
jgi:hypothetical protein